MCYRNRLPLLGGVAVGIWMTSGVGHDLCILSEFGFFHRIEKISPGGRLLNATTKQVWACQHNNTSPPCSSPTPNDPHDANLEASTTNNSNPSTSSANTSTTNRRKTFARFFVVKGLGANKTLRNVNSTILDKTIDGATSVSTKREWMGRSVLVEVNHEAYFTNLMKLNQIGDIPVKVSAHRSLNYAKGVVRFRQATECLTNEDLARDLNMSRCNHDLPQVKEACMVIITKSGKKIQTGTFFLTFDAPTLPERIFLCFGRFDVEPYIPLPRRCFKCQRFGHGALLQGHWRFSSIVLRHRTQARSLPKQRVSNMPKLQGYAFCCQ